MRRLHQVLPQPEPLQLPLEEDRCLSRDSGRPQAPQVRGQSVLLHPQGLSAGGPGDKRRRTPTVHKQNAGMKPDLCKIISISISKTSLHLFSHAIDYHATTAYTPHGLLGIKVWISFKHANVPQEKKHTYVTT